MIFYCCDKYVVNTNNSSVVLQQFFRFFLENYQTNKIGVFNMWERCMKLFEFFTALKSFPRNKNIPFVVKLMLLFTPLRILVFLADII